MKGLRSADLEYLGEVLEEVMRERYEGTNQSFSLWFDRMEFRELDRDHALFVCENEMKRQIIEQRFTGFLAECLGAVVGYEPAVTIGCDPALAPEVPDDGSIVSPLKIVKQRQKEREEREAREREERERAEREKQEEQERAEREAHEKKEREEREQRARLIQSLESEYEPAGGSVDFAESPAMLREEDEPLEGSSERRLTYNPDYTFENFIVGASNRFAHAAALSVADNLGMKINPLFIWGPSGLGKTHLMYAIANRALGRNPNMKVIYVKGEEFVNQMVDAIMKNRNAQFRKKFRSADMLLIDDVQFIAGKEATQMEFFHTFDALYEDKKQIILTSDRPPKELTSLEERIRSRFEAGLLADIQPPDYELRLAILRGKVSQNQIEVPTDVIDFLAQNLQENIRQLEGVVKKLAMANLLTGQPVNMEMVLQTVPEYLREAEPVSETVERILYTVSKRYSVTVEDILGASRKKDIKTARNVSMYIVRSVTGLSLPQIGQVFARDHSTVHSNITAVENDLVSDPVLDATIAEIMKEVKR